VASASGYQDCQIIHTGVTSLVRPAAAPAPVTPAHRRPELVDRRALRLIVHLFIGWSTSLFCTWLAWSRYRVIRPAWDRTLGTLMSCVDTSLRRFGGVPTYCLTDNEKTVTMHRVAGIAVRHPLMVVMGRHYGLQVATCAPYDPESKAYATDCTLWMKWMVKA
jgi:hypothetical protein